MSLLVLFDGDCSFCNSQARFITRRDKKGRIELIPRISEAGEKALASAPDSLKEQDIILAQTDRGNWLGASSAVVRILWQLGPQWVVLGGLLWLVPRPVRDFGYHQFAARRHRLN